MSLLYNNTVGVWKKIAWPEAFHWKRLESSCFLSLLMWPFLCFFLHSVSLLHSCLLLFFCSHRFSSIDTHSFSFFNSETCYHTLVRKYLPAQWALALRDLMPEQFPQPASSWYLECWGFGRRWPFGRGVWTRGSLWGRCAVGRWVGLVAFSWQMVEIDWHGFG